MKHPKLTQIIMKKMYQKNSKVNDMMKKKQKKKSSWHIGSLIRNID